MVRQRLRELWWSPKVAPLHTVPTRVARVLRARWYLRVSDAIGPRTQIIGGPAIVRNDGKLRVGRRVRLDCSYAPVELRAGRRAEIELGDGVFVNFGTSIVAERRITVGSNVRFGPYCVVADREYPDADPDPIVIEDDVWLAARVVVRPGAHIGRGAVVTAGSIVDGVVPPAVIIGGAPTRLIRRLDSPEPSAQSS